MIPAVDISPIGIQFEEAGVSEDSFREVGQQLAKAFAEVGFCRIIGHGIEQDIFDRSLQSGEAFFNKPDNVKHRYLRQSPTDFIGWLPRPGIQGLTYKPETFASCPPDLKETYNVSKWADASKFVSDEEIPGFRTTVMKLLDSMQLLSKRILIAFAYGLDLDDPLSIWKVGSKAELPEQSSNPSQVRFAHYPAVPQTQLQDGQFWCAEHSDFCLISILFNNGVSGLQFLTKEKEFVDVTQNEGSLLLNIGDCLERLTGGRLLSAPHRVVFKENVTKDRYSVNYFLAADMDAYMDPLCGAKEEYGEKITVWDFWLRRLGDEKSGIKKGLCKAYDQLL